MAASWSTDCSKGMKASWSPCLVSVCRLSVCLAPPVHRRGLVALAPQNTSSPPKGGLPACRTMLQSENQRTSGTPSPVQRPLRHGAICEDSSGPVVGFPARLVGCCCHTSNSAPATIGTACVQACLCANHSTKEAMVEWSRGAGACLCARDMPTDPHYLFPAAHGNQSSLASPAHRHQHVGGCMSI